MSNEEVSLPSIGNKRLGGMNEALLDQPIKSNLEFKNEEEIIDFNKLAT